MSLSKTAYCPTQSPIPDSGLPHIGLQRFLPHPTLRPWVQCYWSARFMGSSTSRMQERLYPDGGVSITFNLLDPRQHWFSAKHDLYLMAVNKGMHHVGIRFHPGGAQWLLRHSLHELSDRHYRLADIALTDVNRLSDELIREERVVDQLLLLDQWLLSRCRQLQPEVNIAQQVMAGWGRVDTDLNTWTKAEGINRRRIERAFQRFVGISPGHWKNLSQVSRARQWLKKMPQTALSQVALVCGFYDQAHFNRQFLSITGQTPGHYRRRHLP